MFDLPEAKRVRREDLVSSSGSSSPSLEEYEEAAARSRLRRLLAIDEAGAVSASQGVPEGDAPADVPPTAEEDAFEFRLFAAPKTDGEALQSHTASRIAIRSPSPDDRPPGFLAASRPRSYYLANPPTEEELETFRIAALFGQDVLHESGCRWPGSELPWRVVTIKAPSRKESRGMQVPGAGEDAQRSRKRDGKKRRIAVRKKLAVGRLRQEQEAVETAAKGAAEKAKRTQRNREKKVKKKARDKAKKAGVSGGVDGVGAATEEGSAYND